MTKRYLLQHTFFVGESIKKELIDAGDFIEKDFILLPNIEADGHIHTLPTDAGHIENGQCFCHPYLDYVSDSGTEHWVHNETRKWAIS